jgi:hypothetical protein
VASSVANLIYKPLVLEPGVLILVGSFQHGCQGRDRGSGIDHSYTDLLAVTFVVFFVVVMQRKARPICLYLEINTADHQ